MKKHIIYSLLIGLVILSGCEDKLEQAPISALGSNGFYRNQADFQKALNGAYNQLRQYPINHFELSEVRSDNLYAPGVAGVRDYNLINNFSRNLSTTTLISTTWNDYFNGIMRANTVLDNLNAEAIPEENLRLQIEAESKFLRAVFYFDLVRFFGRVPLFDRTVTPLEALEIPRSSIEEVYNLIIADLSFGISHLPPSYTNQGEVGKATSHAARAMLARVYLTRSGPQLHPQGPTMDSGEWEPAISLLNEIINSGQYTLMDNYSSIFAYDNENNAEIIFDVQFTSGGLGVGGEYVQYHYPEVYARANGIPFAGGTFPDAPKTVSADLMDSYEAEDQRDGFSVQVGSLDQNGNPSNDRFIKKYLDLNHLGVDRFDFELNFPVIRYADILLMKAEALYQINGPSSEIDLIVNQIRERAGLDQPLNGVTYEIILEERRREFIGEGLRWHDLVRSGQVLDVMTAWREKEDEANKISADISANDLIYPVPQNQLDVKQGLYEQNPGY